MDSAVKGRSHIPLEAIAKFVRMAHIYEQKEVLEVLGEKVVDETQHSTDLLMVSRGKALQLMLAMELLSGAQKRCASSKWPSKGAKTESRAASGSQGHDGGRKVFSTKADSGKMKPESSKASSPKVSSKGDGGKGISPKPVGKGEGLGSSEQGGTGEGGRAHTAGKGTRKGSPKGRSEGSEEPLVGESKSDDEMQRKWINGE